MNVIELTEQIDACATRENHAFFRAIANTASEYLGLKGQAEVELVFCSKEEIRSVNYKMRGVNSVTDVLSFPYLSFAAGEYKAFTAENFPHDVNPDTGRVSLGSIMICLDVAKAQAEEYGHGLEREEGYLFLHGLLHLLGFDHMTDLDKSEMRKAEEGILCVMGLKRE